MSRPVHHAGHPILGRGDLVDAIGSGDDFWCFDYEVIHAGPRGEWIVLDATINSETGCFIMGGGYHVLPCNSLEEKRLALLRASDLSGSAAEWVCDNEIRATKSGWNQDFHYFERCVARALFPYKFRDDISERQMRLGGKKVDEILRGLFAKEKV